jgi:phosphoribosylformylglycinamidine (FGAM) synthase-like amidotransferase family enzyme
MSNAIPTAAVIISVFIGGFALGRYLGFTSGFAAAVEVVRQKFEENKR